MTRADLPTTSSGPHDSDDASRTGTTVLLCAVTLMLLLAMPTGVVGEPITSDVASASTAGGLSADRKAALGALQTEAMASLAVSPDPAHPGERVTLDATDSSAGANESIERCEFDTDGDGTFELEAQTCQVVQSYDATGEYDIVVRVVTSADRTATDTETLVVRENEAPVAAISVEPPSPRPGEGVALSTENATDPDGTLVRYRWTIDGRVVSDSTAPTFETSFESTGEYEVGLLVEDDDGDEASTSTSIQVVENRPPAAALAASPVDPVAGEAVELDAGDSTDPEGAIVAYRWDLDGDGTIERETETATTSVTFEAAGDRTVRVVVVDDRDDTDETRVELSVRSANERASASTERTPATGAGSDRSSGFGPLGALDFGIVPFVPDWLVLLVLLGVVGTATVLVRRRDEVESRIEDLRERVNPTDVRRKAGKSGSSFVAKTVFKKAFRKLADVVEGSGEITGGFFEWIGRTIKRGTERVASALRRLGS